MQKRVTFAHNFRVMKRFSIIFAIAALAASCLGVYDPTEETFTTDSTVSAYFKFIRLEEGKIPPHTVMVADMGIERMDIMLSLAGNSIASIYDLINSPAGEKAKTFKEIQAKFNDYNPTPTVYRYFEDKKGNGEWRLESGQCIYYAYGEQISKITITSNVEWTADYPAGKDLAPLFTAEFGSLSKYIQSGYDPNSYLLQRGIVSELTAADFAPLVESDWNVYGGTDILLTTTTLPENYHDHTITISLILDTDEVIEYTDRLSNIMRW